MPPLPSRPSGTYGPMRTGSAGRSGVAPDRRSAASRDAGVPDGLGGRWSDMDPPSGVLTNVLSCHISWGEATA
ncbi:hypothetical protein GCM10010383_19610 [Streptomyces lomondensis]|uniref:Uncharacterized protein n=1 Tax=Streptomyces lomondensis TaxID=68229 RepID=A0ABQ2X0T2_9ACTN|nr:hypothetical protein GCM10010383_19610 [Streptomyces lomondensis]